MPDDGVHGAGAIAVRGLTTSDTPWTSNLHASASQVGLFPALGPAFLQRYHATFIESPAAVALGAWRTGSPGGFLLGVIDTAEHRANLLSRGLGLAACGLSALALHPKLLARFVRTRTRPYAAAFVRQLRRSRQTESHDESHTAALLSHVVVDDAERGRGMGRVLVDAFIAEATDMRSTAVLASTVDRSSWYQSLGWTWIGTSLNFDGVIQHQFKLSLPRVSDRLERKVHERFHAVIEVADPCACSMPR